MNNTIEINVVIGSWGSYNACNESALGSKWLNFADYSCWDEITEELEKQGFKLDGIDEELFIQDIENLPSSGTNWDYVSPKQLFETLNDAGVLNNDWKYDVMQAFLELRSLDEFTTLVDNHGYSWDDDIYIYKGYDWEQYGREMFNTCGYDLDERLEDFFDYEAYGKYIGDSVAEEYSEGLIQIR